MPVYRGQPRQYGQGLGSMFRKAMKTVMPLLKPFVKSGLKTLKNEGLRQGKAVVRDLVDGGKVKDVLGKRGRQALQNVGQSLLEDVGGKQPRRHSKRRGAKTVKSKIRRKPRRQVGGTRGIKRPSKPTRPQSKRRRPSKKFPSRPLDIFD